MFHPRYDGAYPPPPPPPSPRGDFGSGGFRARRGMIEPAILELLLEKPMHGYEVISQLEEKSNGMWRPSAGSIYPTLQLLEEKELVESSEKDGKKVYTLTDKGRGAAELAKEQSDHLRAGFEHFADRDRAEGRRMNLHHSYQRQFHKDMGDVIKLMRQIFRKGTKSQKEAMGEAVEQFKARLNAISEGEI